MDLVFAVSDGSIREDGGEIKDILDGLVEDVERCAALELLDSAREKYEERISKATALFRAMHRSEARVDVTTLAHLTTHSTAEYSYGVLAKEGGLECAPLNDTQDKMSRANQRGVDSVMATVHRRTITRDINELYRAKRVERHEEVVRLQGEVATLTSRVEELEAKLRDPSVEALDGKEAQIGAPSEPSQAPGFATANYRRGWRKTCIWASLVSSCLVVGGILIREKIIFDLDRRGFS